MITTELEAVESQKKKPRWHAPKQTRKPRRKIPKWTTPMHWDRATGELSGARPIPQSSYPAFRPSKFIVRGTETDETTGESEAVGKWFEEDVPKSLRAWVESQEHHTNDQNVLEARRHRVMPASGYTGHRRVDFPKPLAQAECNCVNCRRLPPRVYREAATLYIDSFGYPQTSKHCRADFCAIRYARLAEFVERVEAAGRASEERRDRFNRDPRTVKINQFIANHATPIAVGNWDNNRPQKPRARQTGDLTWFLAKGFIEEPIFRNVKTPMTATERMQRSRELAKLKADQEVDNASGGAAGPGRYLEGADAGKGLLVSGGYDQTRLAQVDSVHNSNVGKNAPDIFEEE
jgi:hypothetical protein